MTISQEQTHFIKKAFGRIKSKNDFLDLLNYAKKIIYSEKAVPFDLRQLNYYITPRSKDIKYTTFTVNKKMGGVRTIHAPVKGLRVLQSCLNLILQQLYEPREEATGFINGRSVYDNAKKHVGAIYVFNLDLKDFFPSIDIARFWGRLRSTPYNLNTHNGNVEIANIICAISAHSARVERLDGYGNPVFLEREVLPQGAPTSPVISNIICENLDRRLKGVAKKFGVVYSRYADDITFSSMHSVYAKNGEFFREVKRIIEDQKFRIKESKSRLQVKGTKQVVTGLVINNKVNVDRKYVNQLRVWLHYWEQFGYFEASRKIFIQYKRDKGHVKDMSARIENIIAGKLEFLKMIKGTEDNVYKKLNNRFSKLLGSISSDETHEHTPVLLDEANSPVIQNASPLVREPVLLPLFKTVHEPKKLVIYLKNFSLNGQALKYTTHSWDAGRDSSMFRNLEDFLEKAHKQYNAFSYPLNLLSSHLNGKIFSFIFRKDVSGEGWGADRVTFGWSSPELQEGTDKNPRLNPEDFILPEKYQKSINGKTIQKFSQIIDIFKNEIEIRGENSALLNLILDKHEKFLSHFKPPRIENLKDKTFYTDVQWLGKALNLILHNIASWDGNKEVKYILNDDQRDRYTLRITHVGSFNKGQHYSDEKLGLSKGSFGDIKTYLMNLCDWSVESCFVEGDIRINYLASDPELQQYETIEPVEGFTHILTFYR